VIARVLRTRNKRANAGEVLTDGSYIRRSGTLPTYMQAARLQGGSIGVHAAEIGASHSLCACALVSPSKANEATQYGIDAPRKRGEAAAKVTYKFCATRLVNAGVLTADNICAAMPAGTAQ
jgi:hypothetical protein